MAGPRDMVAPFSGPPAPRGLGTRVLLAACGVLLPGGRSGPPPAQGPPAPVRLVLEQATVSFLPDTMYGLHVLIEPAAGTTQARSDRQLVWLRFQPDTVLDWLNRAAAALQTTLPSGPAEAIQWSPTLRPMDGRGALAVGRVRKNGKLERAHWLAVADSSLGWRVELTARQADSLLRLFLAEGAQARVDTGSAVPPDRDHVDRPAAPLEPFTSRGAGVTGRVAMLFVVREDGEVEPGSVRTLVASSSRLDVLAVQAVRAMRFRPAERGGRAVRQMVQQVLIWSH